MRVGILRSKMIIALARDPGRDKPCPYFLSQNINQLNFQSTNK
jgi:hypothetical protein